MLDNSNSTRLSTSNLVSAPYVKEIPHPDPEDVEHQPQGSALFLYGVAFAKASVLKPKCCPSNPDVAGQSGTKALDFVPVLSIPGTLLRVLSALPAALSAVVTTGSLASLKSFMAIFMASCCFDRMVAARLTSWWMSARRVSIAFLQSEREDAHLAQSARVAYFSSLTCGARHLRYHHHHVYIKRQRLFIVTEPPPSRHREENRRLASALPRHTPSWVSRDARRTCKHTKRAIEEIYRQNTWSPIVTVILQ